jgi:hypothetical protein
MKRIRLALPLIILALAAQPAIAGDTSSKIIDRFKKASGGNALKRIRTTFISGSLKSADGATGRFLYQTAGPDRIRTDIEVGSIKISECYNGKSAWRMDQRGLRTLLGSEAKRLRLEALIANSRLQDLPRSRIIPQPPVKASIDGRDANAMEVIKDDVRAKLFFDASTNLLIKQERERSDGVEELFYSDYRAVDGVMEPFAMRIKSGGAELVIGVDRLEHNRILEEAAFRHPKVEGERPLPDLEALMKTIIGNQEKVEELFDRYTFRETQTERKPDSNGQMRDGDTKIYEITPVYKRPVRRLMSVNGKELSPSEREKEDRRVQKAVEDLVKRHEEGKEKEQKKLQKKEEQAKAGDKKGQEDDDDEISLLDFLRISEITSVRREMFRGHEVIAFDFEPRKNFKPRNRGENLVSKLAGTMWVDETAKQVARAEARLTDSFKIGGGLLASVSPATAIVIEQEKIGDEVWLPSYNEVNLSVRLFLLAKLKRNFVTRYSDYRKYKIDDKYELAKPKEASKP